VNRPIQRRSDKKVKKTLEFLDGCGRKDEGEIKDRLDRQEKRERICSSLPQPKIVISNLLRYPFILKEQAIYIYELQLENNTFFVL